MKVKIIILLPILLIAADTTGQSNSPKEYTPFSILIISPDSISLHESLKPLIDTVESAFRDMYYSSLKEMEIREKMEQQDEKQKTQLQIQRAKRQEMEIHNVKYFHLISMFTCSELWYLFGEKTTSGFSFDFISKEELFSYDPGKIANHFQIDYVLTYKNISTPIENGEPVLKIVAELFSKKDSKVIYKLSSTGYARFYKSASGVLMSCDNDLRCLLESAAVASSIDLFQFLEKRQSK